MTPPGRGLLASVACLRSISVWWHWELQLRAAWAWFGVDFLAHRLSEFLVGSFELGGEIAAARSQELTLEPHLTRKCAYQASRSSIAAIAVVKPVRNNGTTASRRARGDLFSWSLLISVFGQGSSIPLTSVRIGGEDREGSALERPDGAEVSFVEADDARGVVSASEDHECAVGEP